MKKNLLHFLLVLIVAFLLSRLLPWYAIMIASFSIALFVPLKKAYIFFIPFLAIALLWMAQAYLLSNANDFILAKKIAQLLPLGGNPYLLILVTGVIGGIAAGIAGVFGKQIASIVKS